MNNFKSKETNIKCICPRCSIIHIKPIYWTGRGIPRKYCSVCSRYSKKMEFINEPLNITRVVKQKRTMA